MTRFSVWSPDARKVAVALLEPGPRRVQPLTAAEDGWWTAEIPGAAHGTDYGFLLDDRDDVLPDPRSSWQPRGVHAPGRVYDHSRFRWSDASWRGRPLPGSVLYELHVGTFTPEGTLDAAAARLGHLVDLGVDAVELMPVAAFSGERGWGYDGVCLWAVHEPYGGPDALKRFVDTAHARGIAVVLDVVHNHLGPSGNHLKEFGPYVTDAYATPWGDAINFDQAGSDGVRAFVVENALMWLRDFHVDGLRLDAVHALRDQRAVHILEELSVAVDALAARLGRGTFLVAESDLNDPRVIAPREAGGHGLTAQWDDDVHHALHALLTGERQGYYTDFGSTRTLAKALTSAFVHDGSYSAFRGRRHGRPVDRARTPAHRFVVSLQNHDQVGNRAAGDRLSGGGPGERGLPLERLKIGAAFLLLGPFTPMLFMGEEWGASTPWCYFTDHREPWLARAVTEGRRREFAAHGWQGEVPDPQAVDTFRRSVLDWAEPAAGQGRHRALLDWYRALIALRRAHPEFTDPDLTRVHVETGDTWTIMRRGRFRVAANLGEDVLDLGPADLLLTSGKAGPDRMVSVWGTGVAVVADGGVREPT
ncbi:malto-oligosyltrehalose trehalohydrolase [Actinomadura harenae]|uniref:Malto-oligosyltrehalose trehalohydrolase n=1 Tax=Actinomadura harenae TaxID=2483351 RepID=A0A3M2MBZ0_9ACTN|nr:malto-oligosyltrehalose trehalohydrolase [Actinomadura harenae]RMI47021.1 malto-oligosyltrehalose trehalohydrolase [Actinomadura harenae]